MNDGEAGLSEVEQDVVAISTKSDGGSSAPKQNMPGTHLPMEF